MMKKLTVAAVIATALALPAFAFNAAPSFDPTDGAYLECAIVKLMPPSPAGRDPVYKVNIKLTYDQNRTFQSIEVYHTLVSGRSVDRSQQYTTARRGHLSRKPMIGSGGASAAQAGCLVISITTSAMAGCTLKVSGAALPPCHARREPQDATTLDRGVRIYG